MSLCSLSAVELVRTIRAKEVSARDVLSAYLARIDALNPRLNAIVTLHADRAMERARIADEAAARGAWLGPLHGLPIAHKDLQPTAGVRTTFGSPLFAAFVPDEDAPLVTRLREAGAIAIGKTNTPEFGAGSQTFNPVFGATLNPYDTTKTCGGSSGGAAVALAARMLPIADGSDMGGSLRNPAAFCGVVGLRPSPGLVPSLPPPDTSPLLSVDGPMARTSADVALLLGAMTRRDLPPIERRFDGVRVAWWTDLGGAPVDRRVADAVNARRATFEALGCRVEAAEPDLTGADATFKALRARAFAVKFGELVRRHPGMVKETIVWEIERGERLSADAVAAAEACRLGLQTRARRFMQRFEFFVLPTTQVPPFDVREPFVRDIAGVPMETYIDWMKSCYYISVLGHPAISVPCGITADGLPVGLQIVARAGDDWGLLQMAAAFEAARGPFAAPALDDGAGRDRAATG
jgi:amidase